MIPSKAKLKLWRSDGAPRRTIIAWTASRSSISGPWS